MIDLSVDIGYTCINCQGEILCGDRVDIVEQEDNSYAVVLADGLGHGAKANILSTLTSKILSTMVASGLPIEECVATVAETLPVSSELGVAYSTFTVLHLLSNDIVEIVQYDNPQVILLRDGKNFEYPITEKIIGGKKILSSIIKAEENDVFIAMSDGCTHAGIGLGYQFGWSREDIVNFLEAKVQQMQTAKSISVSLIEECERLYDYKPGDDASVCAVRFRKRAPVNILFGPSYNLEDTNKMMEIFFSKTGKHIVCGGTTSTLAAKFLGKELEIDLNFNQSNLPPVAKIEGIDLVTEGVVTLSRVLEFAKDYLSGNAYYEYWSTNSDGASKIGRVLFEEATDVNFVVGRAINPAHQNPDLPINFNIKMNLVEELTKCLRQMGKQVTVQYF